MTSGVEEGMRDRQAMPGAAQEAKSDHDVGSRCSCRRSQEERLTWSRGIKDEGWEAIATKESEVRRAWCIISTMRWEGEWSARGIWVSNSND